MRQIEQSEAANPLALLFKTIAKSEPVEAGAEDARAALFAQMMAAGQAAPAQPPLSPSLGERPAELAAAPEIAASAAGSDLAIVGDPVAALLLVSTAAKQVLVAAEPLAEASASMPWQMPQAQSPLSQDPAPDATPILRDANAAQTMAMADPLRHGAMSPARKPQKPEQGLEPLDHAKGHGDAALGAIGDVAQTRLPDSDLPTVGAAVPVEAATEAQRDAHLPPDALAMRPVAAEMVTLQPVTQAPVTLPPVTLPPVTRASASPSDLPDAQPLVQDDPPEIPSPPAMAESATDDAALAAVPDALQADPAPPQPKPLAKPLRDDAPLASVPLQSRHSEAVAPVAMPTPFRVIDPQPLVTAPLGLTETVAQTRPSASSLRASEASLAMAAQRETPRPAQVYAPDLSTRQPPPQTADTPFALPLSAETALPFDLPATEPAPSAAPVAMDQPDWEVQLVDRIMMELTGDGGKIELSLSPENLGRLEVTLELRDGRADVSFVTDTQAAADLITQSETRLSDLLAKSGLDLAGQGASPRHGGREQQGGEPRPFPQSLRDMAESNQRPLPAHAAAEGRVNLIA